MYVNHDAQSLSEVELGISFPIIVKSPRSIEAHIG
jgi:hypothetical protein